MSTEQDLEAKRKLFERRLEHPWKITLAWVAELPPYRFAVWVNDLKPVHIIFDASDLTALGKQASDDEWFAAFGRKLEQELARQAMVT